MCHCVYLLCVLVVVYFCIWLFLCLILCAFHLCCHCGFVSFCLIMYVIVCVRHCVCHSACNCVCVRECARACAWVRCCVCLCVSFQFWVFLSNSNISFSDFFWYISFFDLYSIWFEKLNKDICLISKVFCEECVMKTKVLRQ